MSTYFAKYLHILCQVSPHTLPSIPTCSLIPFLVDGTDNHFWYTFAITVIVGLAASFVALVFIMPWWLRLTF